jgi:hypothetical protein
MHLNPIRSSETGAEARLSLFVLLGQNSMPGQLINSRKLFFMLLEAERQDQGAGRFGVW